MAQTQNYEVYYDIKVNATEGTEQVTAFANAVEKLSKGRVSFAPVVTNINEMMQAVEKTFRGKNGKKKDFNFDLEIRTGETEKRLEGVKNLLTEIKELTQGIKLTINPGEKIDGRALRNQTNKLVGKKKLDEQQAEAKRNAASAVKSVMDTQRTVTRSIGKINSALAHLEKGREVNIKTDAARVRLQEILTLLGNIRGAATMTLHLNTAAPATSAPVGPVVRPPYAPVAAAVLSDKEQAGLNKRLYADEAMNRQRMQQAREKAALQVETFRQMSEIRAAERAARLRESEHARADRELRKIAERTRREELNAEKRRRQAEETLRRRNAARAVTSMRRQAAFEDSVYGSKRRAAINRIQYSKAPSWRNLPMAGMLNAYMAYNFLRTQFTEAVEYSNIMQSAYSILRVADSDLTTFEGRFDRMARYVRRIGVETKFTAIEVAGAVKFLSMAGMNIETINESIRPITNLALIGDNDISQIADLATNIQTGYNIKNTSMGSVADILASTVSRSNVNIIEMAESFKMAAGYLRLSGVDFTEASAAIGVLGNMGIKGTMAGTALRAMATRFAKPTKEAREALDRLGVKFTRMEDIYGKQVEKLRPLADIFEDLNKKGATMADMQTIFGKIGGNAAMMFVSNYGQLRTLASQNRASQGISSELAQVKQDTTKGLWYQMTSQLTESFMQGYELIEPVIRSTLKDFLAKFNSREFARGLASIGQGVMSLLSVLGSFASWMTRNFYWIEPLLFTGFVATRLFKLAGALTNVGVAVGFIGKQAAGNSIVELVSGLTGLTSARGIKVLSFANKRALVTALQAAGISGKGAMGRALLQGGAGSFAARAGFSSLFSSQVATGGGLVGAAGSLSAIGTTAVAATAGIAALVGALGWVAYKTWQIKKAKDAVLEDITANEKYRYPVIEDLYAALHKTYQQAIDTKKAVDDLTTGKTIEESSGHKIGAFTKNWWAGWAGTFAVGASDGMITILDVYGPENAQQDDSREAITAIARRDSQSRLNAAYAEFGKMSDPLEVRAFIENIALKYGQQAVTAAEAANKLGLDKPFWFERNGKVTYTDALGDLPEVAAAYTPTYAAYQNSTTVKHITTAAQGYLDAIESMAGARALIEKSGFDYGELTRGGFTQNKDGLWVQKALNAQATDKERQEMLAGRQRVHHLLVNLSGTLRQVFGGSSEAAENILRKAGFSAALYANEPDSNDTSPFNANRITGVSGDDDGGAGGNYSGTGRLSSAAPKQVIVNITNLMSVETIDLLKSPEGQTAEIQHFKEQMAQALIDVVHDFDASWNG
ncbi:phage tail tape measure protein [uncultured Alistipes sp.]|jgi:phage tail tape measure protein, TP901 family|uniref:phage tail tape measure protein n=1 Tax=uncultured Alistipes sp. TaxID=538949 RepID=UPI0020505133|nr:phage tail tape measure protein [uncultured Alistipes sp.]DAW59049.1 MAG TPA: minor tail protein [Caudoviricetes sp.]